MDARIEPLLGGSGGIMPLAAGKREHPRDAAVRGDPSARGRARRLAAPRKRALGRGPRLLHDCVKIASLRGASASRPSRAPATDVRDEGHLLFSCILFLGTASELTTALSLVETRRETSRNCEIPKRTHGPAHRTWNIKMSKPR